MRIREVTVIEADQKTDREFAVNIAVSSDGDTFAVQFPFGNPVVLRGAEFRALFRAMELIREGSK
jgi:hypothetical protein